MPRDAPRDNEEQPFLLRLSDALRPLSDAVEIQAVAARLLGEHLGADRAYYVKMDEARQIATVEREYRAGEAPSLVGEHSLASYGASVGPMRAGRPVVVEDSETDAAIRPGDLPAYRTLSLRAFVTTPLLKDGELVCAICVVSAGPRAWTDGEIALVEETAERTWAAVERARAEAAVRESEARLAALFEALPVGVGVADTNGRFTLSNPELRRFLPTCVIPSRDEARGPRWRAWHPDGRPVDPHDYPGARALRGERVVPGTEMLYRGDDDREVWASVTAAPIRDDDGRVTGLVSVIQDIDAAKRAGDALRESRAFHELVAGLGSDWWFSARVEPDGAVVTESVSEGFTRLLGYTRDELMAAGGWGVVVHPDDRPEAGRQMARLLAGETIEGELRHVARGGRVTWSQYRTRPERDEAGRVARVYGVARDVTERKQTERALKASEEQFRGLAEAVPQIVWSSLGGSVDYYNGRWFEYTGLDQDSWSWDDWSAVIHPDDRPRALEHGERTLRTGEDYEVEYRLRRRDGAYRWHIARAILVPSLGRWFGTATDVHDLREVVAALGEREEQLALAQRAAGLGVSSLDLGTMEGLTTPEWRAVVGMPDPPAPQDFAAFLARVHPDDRDRLSELHSRPPGPEGVEFEFRTLHPARGERWVLSRSRLLPGRDGGPGSLVGIALDITDRKRAEDALRAGQQRLQAVANNLPNGALFVVDADLRYVLAGGAALGPAGFVPADLEGKTMAEAIGPELAAEYGPRYRRALAGESLHNEHSSHGRHYATHLAPLRDASGEVAAALAVSYDITDRKRAEGALAVAEERLRLALSAARMGTWHWEVATDLHQRDANLNLLLGLEAVDTRAPFDEFLSHIHLEDRPHVRRAFDQSVRRGRPLNVEFRVVRPDGATIWLRDQGDVFGTAGAPRLAGACVDVTDLKEAELALKRARDELEDRVTERTADLEAEMRRRRQLSQRLARAQEDERRRVARDLHDSVGQLLAGLGLTFRAIEGVDDLDPAVRGRIDSARRIVEALGKEVHGLASRLRPTSLDDLGLEAALGQLVAEFSATAGVRADFQAAGVDSGRLPAEVETILYRLVQEALTNVTKHARATVVGVVISRPDGHVTALIEDDGVGFDPGVVPAGRLGLVGMRERVSLAGGEMEVESRPGAGTAISIRIPIPSPEAGP